MKRRTFIISATATAVVVAIPVIYYRLKHKETYNPLVMPRILGKFCKEHEIREIGKQYRSVTRNEDNKERLTELLLTDNAGHRETNLNNVTITRLMSKKIHEEFQAYHTLVIRGWVISKTEARQCALFSLLA